MDRSLEPKRRSILWQALAAMAISAALAVSVPWKVGHAASGIDWNDYAIRWQPYTLALSMAKRENKPILLVVYAEWCPHCAAYSKVFHDPRIVEKAKDLVMVRVDADKDPSLEARFAPDGRFVPRAFLLTPEGQLVPESHADLKAKDLSLSARDAGEVLAALEQARTQIH